MATTNSLTENMMEQPSVTRFQVYANDWISRCNDFSTGEGRDLEGFQIINTRFACTFWDYIYPHWYAIMFTYWYSMYVFTMTTSLKLGLNKPIVNFVLMWLYSMMFIGLCKLPFMAVAALIPITNIIIVFSIKYEVATIASEKAVDTIKAIFSKTHMFSLSTIDMVDDLTEFLAGHEVPDRPVFVRNLFVYAIAEGNDVSALAAAFVNARSQTFHKPTTLLWHTIPVMALYCSYILSLYDFDGSKSTILSMKATFIASAIGAILVSVRLAAKIRRPIANTAWWITYIWTMHVVPKALAAISVEQPQQQPPNLLILSWFQFVVGMVFMIASIIFLERDLHPASVLSKAMNMYNGHRSQPSAHSSHQLYRSRSAEHVEEEVDWAEWLITADLKIYSKSKIRNALKKARAQAKMTFTVRAKLPAVEHKLTEFGFKYKKHFDFNQFYHPWNGSLTPCPLDVVFDPPEAKFMLVGNRPIDRPTVPIWNPLCSFDPPIPRDDDDDSCLYAVRVWSPGDDRFVYLDEDCLHALGLNIIEAPSHFYEPRYVFSDVDETNLILYRNRLTRRWIPCANHLLAMYNNDDLLLIEPNRLCLMYDSITHNDKTWNYYYVDINLDDHVDGRWWGRSNSNYGAVALHPKVFMTTVCALPPTFRFDWKAPYDRAFQIKKFFMIQYEDYITDLVSYTETLRLQVYQRNLIENVVRRYAIEHMDEEIESPQKALEKHQTAMQTLLSINIDSEAIMKEFCDFTALLTSLITSMDIEDPLARNLNRGSALYSYCKDHYRFIYDYIKRLSVTMQKEITEDPTLTTAIEHSDEELTKTSGIFKWISTHVDMSLLGPPSALFGVVLPVVLLCPFFAQIQTTSVIDFIQDVAWKAHVAARQEKGISYLVEVCTNFFNHFATAGPSTRERTTKLQKQWVEAVRLNVVVITGGASDKPVSTMRDELIAIEKFHTDSLPFYSDSFASVISQRAAQVSTYIQNATNAIRLANRRKEPYVFTLYGESGVGKSTLATILIDYTHKIKGNIDTKHVAVVQATTKHADTVTNRSTAVLFDDLANFKLEHQPVKEGPYDILWSVTGPTPAPVAKAAVEEKGNTAFYGHVVAVCTNSEKLNVDAIAVKPWACIRRFGDMWEVDYSPEFKQFCNGGIKPPDDYSCMPSDLQRKEWLALHPIKDKCPVPNNLVFSKIHMTPKHGGIERKTDPPIDHLIFFMRFDEDFRSQQIKAENNLRHTSQDIDMCEKCNKHPSICGCAREHSDDEYPYEDNRVYVQLDPLDYTLPFMQRQVIVTQQWWQYLLVQLDDDKTMLHQSCVAAGALILDVFEFIIAQQHVIVGIIMGGALIKHPLTPVLVILLAVAKIFERFMQRYRAYNAYVRVKSLFEITDSTSDMLGKTVKTVIGIAALFGAYSGIMRLMHNRGQRAIEHKSEEVDGKYVEPLVDVNSKETHFREPRRRLVNVAERAHTTSLPDLQKASAKNVYYMEMSCGGVIRRGNLFMIKQGVAAINAHYVRDIPEKSVLHFLLQRDGRKAAEITIPIRNVKISEEKDLALLPMIIPDVPKNLEEYITNETIPRGHVLAGRLLRCDKQLLDRDFNLSVEEGTYCIASMPNLDLTCYTYCLNIPSEHGFCGAPMLLDHGNFVTIAGLHSAASCDNAKICYAVPITKKDLDAAMAKFGTHTTVSKGVCEVHSHDITAEVHPRSIVRKLSPDKGLYTTIVGVGNSTHTPRNNWLPYEHKDTVIEVFGMEPTKVPVRMSKAAELVGAAKGAGPIHMFDNKIMDIAIDDFMVGVDERVDKINAAIKEGNTSLRNSPLTAEEVIHGVPGNKVLKGFNMSTSAGYPFFKKKHNLFIPVTENDFVMIPDAEQAINHAMELVEAECANDTPFCSTLKSELKSVAKANDPRTFYTGGIASLFIVGKYASPIIQVFASDPIHFETFSGLDPVSPDAQAMHDHLASKSTTNIIAGDFKAMDKNLGPHLKIAVRNIFVRIAKRMNYTESEIKCLEIVFDHLIAPLIMVDGNTVILPNVNTSGTLLTVIFNGAGESIAFRYFLEETWQLISKLKAQGMSLRDIAALLTMGDDNNKALSDECLERAPGVDCLSYRDFLKKFGMEYTSPDKEADLLPFYDLYETVFCQRKYVWNAEMDKYLLGIDPNTFINAMCYHERKHSPDDVKMRLVALGNDYCREMAVYGREKYDNAQETVLTLLSKLEIPPSAAILESYDTRIATFKTNGFYARHEKSEVPPNFAIEHMESEPVTATGGDPITTDLVDKAGVTHGMGSDPLPTTTGNTGTHLGAWTSRKVQIMRERFPPGTMRKILFPFSAYLKHPSIKPKVDGYAGVRGNMQLTIEISCTPGHYASIFYGVIPYDEFNPVSDRFFNVEPKNWDAHTSALLSQQTLGGMILLPEDKGAHMDVPLMTNKAYVSLSSDLYLANTALCFMSMPDIRHFQRVEEPITIIVYASMPNIELIGATAAAQYQADEARGPVTKVLSAAVDVAAFIAGVSSNHAFPAHLSTGLTAARDIAAIAGFSRPVDVSAQSTVQLETPYMSVTNVHDICVPLGLDAVNQVVLGPHIAGDDSDPMNISSIISRKGLFAAFTWTKDVGMGETLAQFPVSPVSMLATTSYMLPCAYIANMFEYWQGTLVYTFYLVSTTYHAGSISIEYDPVTARHDDADFPLVRKSLLDITSLKRVEMTVHWQSPDFMKRNRTMESPAVVSLANAGSLSNTLSDNGIIKMRVQSPLTSNVAQSAGGTHDATVLIFLRAHPDMAFAIPRDPYMGKYEIESFEPEWIGSKEDYDYYNLDLLNDETNVRTPDNLLPIGRDCVPDLPGYYNPYAAVYCGTANLAYTLPSEGFVTVVSEDLSQWIDKPAGLLELPEPEEPPDEDEPPSVEPAPAPASTDAPAGNAPSAWFPTLFPGSSAPVAPPPAPTRLPTTAPTRVPTRAPTTAPTTWTPSVINGVERMNFSRGVYYNTTTGKYTIPTNTSVTFYGFFLNKLNHTLTFTARLIFNEPCVVTFVIQLAGSQITETASVSSLGLQVLTVTRPILAIQVPTGTNLEQNLEITMSVSAGTPELTSFKMPSRNVIQGLVPANKIMKPVNGNSYYPAYPLTPNNNYETPRVPWYEPSMPGELKPMRGAIACIAEGPYLSVTGTTQATTNCFFEPSTVVTWNNNLYISMGSVGVLNATPIRVHAVYVERSPNAVEQMDSLLEPVKVPANNMLRQHFIGEGISSLRTMLRRSELLGSYKESTNGTIPKWPISSDSSWHLYILSAFLGVRGSYRVRIMITNSGTIPAVVEFYHMAVPKQYTTAMEIVVVRDFKMVTLEIPYYCMKRYDNIWRFSPIVVWKSNVGVKMQFHYCAGEDLTGVYYIGYPGARLKASASA